MRITHLRPRLLSLGRCNAIFVEIETDTGLVGLGETVLRRRDQSVMANLAEIGEFLVGRVPLATEDIFEKLYRDTFWVGGPLHAAGRSAVDIALWDIKAQHLGAPIHHLLGGPTRSEIPVYAHCPSGATPEEFASNLLDCRARGFRAAKTTLPLYYGARDGHVGVAYSGGRGVLDPSLKETEYLPTAVFDRIAAFFGCAREAVGPDFELMLDCHGRLNLANAVRLVDALAPYRLLFIEEPLPPESADEYARLSARSVTPIAAGERLVSSYDVRPYLERGAVGILQSDVVNCGGFTGARKIAAMAEAYYVPFAPHNPNGPIATLAAAHLLASIPNAYLLETVGSEEDAVRFEQLVDHPPQVRNGILSVPERPGIGAALLPDAAQRFEPAAVAGHR